jgi:glycerol-3-phosphate acyltransferase PlsX
MGTVRTVSDGAVRVAVDAMGGDHAPLEVVAGTLAWARAHPADQVLLVGIPSESEKRPVDPMPANVEIVPASQVVEMDESPALALKAKKDSSIMVAMDLLKQGRADALVTAGHSGAGMAAAVLKLGRLPGVDRPALAVQMITETGPFVLLDIGANMDSTGHNLYQFAHMGSLYAERVLGVQNPRVALLSIGEEKGKGDLAIQQATKLLDEDGSLNFVGNVEGRDLVKHMADVAVCDAVVGNVTMKFFEGLARFIFDLWARSSNALPSGRSATCSCAPV